LSIPCADGGVPVRIVPLFMRLPCDMHSNWLLGRWDKDYRLTKLYGQMALLGNSKLFRQIVSDHRIEIIHFMDNQGFGIQRIKRLFGSALVTATAVSYSRGGCLLRWPRHVYIRRSYGAADAIITRTHAMKRWLVELGLPERKIHTIHWGVRSGEAVSAERSAQARQTLGVPTGATLLLWSGHIAQVQRGSFHATLAVARELIQRRKDVFFVFAFKPYHYDSSLARLESDRIRIRTDIPDFPALLAAADLLVSPVVRPDCIVPLPLTWIEAMAAGTPVMTTPVGGVDELISHELDGWVARLERFPGDIDRLLDNRDMLAELSVNAIQKVRSQFNTQTSVRQYQDLWQTCRAGGK
jgi:glycosyltransferase involved in cell wall biosynthesis